MVQAGSSSLVRCASSWHADGRRLNSRVRQHSFMEIGHEIISMAMPQLLGDDWTF